jgi:TolB-like protein/Tfp pilus assembly protein PilF/predicted Ser/Thr protein kinase
MGLPAGHRLGPYEVVAPLGAGGMGEVYLARDVRLDRTVAVKILPRELAVDERYRQRFEREARAASALSHPHIAHVYDVGEQDGTHFIAMEYVEGENLRDLATRGPLDVDRVVEIGAQMASALEEAHARGVVHRDIKSANAVVTPKGQVKVLDFGLARRDREGADLGGSQQVTEARTQVGIVVGTVPYMSPEQALGKDLDARTDLFSLGVVLYELATGRLPFVGNTATQTIDQICHATPVELGASRKDIPAELERIVRKCLEKDRDRRYASARDLVVDLRNLQRDRASGTGPVAAAPRRRGRRLLAAGAAALLAVVAVGAGLLYRASARGASIESVAVLPFENATGDPANEYLSDGISESLINKLSSLPGLRVISRTSAFSFKGKKLGPAEIGRALGVDALLVGSLAQRGASLAITAELVSVRDDRQLWGEKYNRSADDVLKVEGEIAATIARTLRGQLSGEQQQKLARGATADPEAYRLYLKGRDFLVGNQQEMDKSVDYFQQAVARAPEYALAHAGLAEAYTRQAGLRASGREEPLRMARAAVSRALELDPDLAEAHTALGLIHFFFEWDWAGAEAAFQRALALNPGSRAVQEEYGWFLTSMGRLDEGLAHSREASLLDPLSVGPVHDIAINYMARGDLEQAATNFRRTIDMDPNWTWGYVKLGRTLAQQKKCPEALAQAEIAERRIAGGAAPLSRAWLGFTYGICGETVRARQKLEELHALSRERYVDPSLYAEIHSGLGEADEALRWYEKAYEDRTPSMAYASVMSLIDPGLIGNPRYEAIVRRMAFPPR